MKNQKLMVLVGSWDTLQISKIPAPFIHNFYFISLYFKVQVKYLDLFEFFPFIESLEWFWMGSFCKNIQLILEFVDSILGNFSYYKKKLQKLYGSFLSMGFSCLKATKLLSGDSLLTSLMLSVMLLSMLIILLSIIVGF